tara:strand:- start:183 stop:359 length:177 start_codon:yes stop_codon:yes gene_type:complete
MSEYILKRNLIRENGEVIKVGEPLPSDIDDEVIKIYIEKGIIRKKRSYNKAAPKPEGE